MCVCIIAKKTKILFLFINFSFLSSTGTHIINNLKLTHIINIISNLAQFHLTIITFN